MLSAYKPFDKPYAQAYRLHPVLQALALSDFSSTIDYIIYGSTAPNKDQQVDQLSINAGVHELHGGQLSACILSAAEKVVQIGLPGPICMPICIAYTSLQYYML